MLDPKIVALMNKELDGANSPDESAKLRSVLEAEAEARAYFQDLKSSMDLLRNAPGPEPGALFKAKIMAFLQREAEPEKEHRPFWAPLFEPIKLKYALFFGLGLGLGLLLLLATKYRVIDNSGWDTRQLTGTVVEAEGLRPLETARWDASGLRQELEIRGGEGRLSVGLRGSVESEVSVTLAFATGQMSLAAVYRISGEQGGVDLLPGKVVLRVSGPHDYLVLFQAPGNPPSSLEVRASAAGETLFSRSFAWPKGK